MNAIEKIGVLSGTTCIEVAGAVAGPAVGLHLRQAGARVIKIEPPDGDMTRMFQPYIGQDKTLMSVYFAQVNRGKESVVLNLKEEPERRALRSLIANADFLVSNSPSDEQMEKLGYGPNDVEEINPDLINLMISAYGRNGLAGRKGYDLLLQAESGSMRLAGDQNDDSSWRYPTPLVDLTTGLLGYALAMEAYIYRLKGGGGKQIDVSLHAAQTYLMSTLYSAYLTTGIEPKRCGNEHPQIGTYATFEAKNGEMVIAIASDRMWRRFCELLEIEELIDDERFVNNEGRSNNRDILRKNIEDKLEKKTIEEWLDIFSDEITATKVQSVKEFLDLPAEILSGIADLQELAPGLLLHLIKSPVGLSNLYLSPAPFLGEHTQEIKDEFDLNS